MRKKWIIVTVMIILLFVACSKEQPATQKSNKESSISEETNSGMVGEPPRTTHLRSLEQLKEMREMLNCEDEEKLYQYLRSIPGGGTGTREELAEFIKFVDEILILQLIEGEITYIEHRKKQDKYDDIAYIVIESKCEERVAIVYNYSTENVPLAMKAKEEKGEFKESLIKETIKSKKHPIEIYFESRGKGYDGEEEVISWYADFNGVFAWIRYFAKDVSNIKTEELIENATLTKGVEDFMKQNDKE